MRPIDADVLKDAISQKLYPIFDAFNSHDYGMFWTGIEKAIDEQPTVNKWVPCSERLPEDGQVVLITVKAGTALDIGISDEDTVMEAYYYADEYTYPCFVPSIGVEHLREEVLAWMPLPEPYQEEGDQ